MSFRFLKPFAAPLVLFTMVTLARAIGVRRFARAAGVTILTQVGFLLVLTTAAYCQSPGKASPAFEVASIKLDKSGGPPWSNFPLNSGDWYTPNGGVFSSRNWPLVTYIFFAYKLMGNQGRELARQLPGWAMTEHYDIEARGPGDVRPGHPAKDEMRLMMRSLLAGRFRLALHSETREMSVFALVLSKPGKTGPQLRPHPADAPCETTVPPAFTPGKAGDPSLETIEGFPALCNGILGLPPSVPGRSRLGGRNITIAFLADMLSQRVDLGRPLIDATGLTGAFDFLLEFVPESRSVLPAANAAPDDGPTFDEALCDQLGLKRESRKSGIEFLVLDHVERPSEN